MLTYEDNDGYPTTELFTINIGEAYYDEAMYTEVGVYDELSMVSRSGLYGLAMAIDDAGTVYVMGNAYDMDWDENDNPVYTADETASLWSVGLEYDSWSEMWMMGWELKKIGNVEQTMDFLQSMTWDHNTEKLYWARMALEGYNPVSELYVVDVEIEADEFGEIISGTVATTKVGNLSGEISGLFAPLSDAAAAKEAHQNIPEMNPEPETLETTDLSQTEFKTYIEGLKDLGGALSFLANYTTELEEVWGELVSAYKAAIAEEKATWFEIKHPKLDKSVFFTGQPSAMGLPAMSVGSVLETNLFITPTNAPAWETKSA
jgi:hypothetical protein